ncbi:DUF3566 domain-containing protein [Cellulomonas endophytica]|uniref:DUF3566 domain-containing protein n=1 Tax=Cellulomonas endophytica TaxID=2494735 RepID=UPI00196ABCE6|nr:DUF3566 domain-containing protein [Cellulomonas endophytica]
MSEPAPPSIRPARPTAGGTDAKDAAMSRPTTTEAPVPRTVSSGAATGATATAGSTATATGAGAPTGTTTGPRPAGGPAAAPRPAPAGTGPRRVRLSISRVDPWSVMKLSFLLSFAVGIIIVVAAAVVWLTLDGIGVFARIDELVTTVIGEDSPVTLLDYLAFPRVVSAAMLVAVVDVVLLTALSTLGAFLYNIVAALVGGLHVTMTDD